MNARSQRRMIAAWLSRHDWVSADVIWDHYRTTLPVDRNAWSSRLGGLVKAGLLEHGDLVPGRGLRPQMVLSYRLTEAGTRWRDDLLRED